MTFKRNIQELQTLKAKATGDNKSNIQTIIELYQNKKIPNYKTAFNASTALASKHKATISSGKPETLYNTIINQYSNAEPITGRLKRAEDFTIRTGNHENVKSFINFEFKPPTGEETRTPKQLVKSFIYI